MALPNPNAQAYDRWFAIADADRDGRVTGKDAVGGNSGASAGEGKVAIQLQPVVRV